MKEEKNPLTEATILGFNPIPGMGIRVNTTPDLGLWANSKAQYDQFKGLKGQTVQFTSRRITTKAGVSRVVYDLNVEEVDNVDSYFTEAAVPTTTSEARPF